MSDKDITTYKYFIEEYWYGINGGGTFTLEQLIEEFKKSENQNTRNNLLNEAKYLKEILQKEDWEIRKNILEYLLQKGSKNKMKRIVDCLITRL